jgi:hypothetical protein
VPGWLLGTSFGSEALNCPGGAGGSPEPVGFSSCLNAVFMNANTPGFPTQANGKPFSAANVSNCNPDSSWSQLGTRTLWNPVPDLDIGFDLSWVHLNTAFAGTANLNIFGTPFQQDATGRPAGAHTISNQDADSAMFRIQRSFLY